MVEGQVEAPPEFAGKYRLLEEIGAGAMGIVRRARDDVLDTDVAVKVFSRQRDPAAAEASLSEARAIARLTHPAIVRVIDHGTLADGAPFVVMELLRGETLAAALERAGKLDATNAIRLLLPVVDALSVAHAQGIVHRDLKPANLFLATDDRGGVQPKVLDFGIALTTTTPSADDGVVVGTPTYMSPEQAMGEPTGPASDIWSLSVVLYEALVGVPPFDDADPRKLIRAIIDKPPRPIRPGEVDVALIAILQRGLRKNPTERFTSMRDLGRELAEWLLGEGVTEDVSFTSVRAAWITAPATFESRPLVLGPTPRPAPLHAARHSKTVVVSTARRGPHARRQRLIIGGALILIAGLLLTAWLVFRSTPGQAARADVVASATARATPSPSAAVATTPPTPSGEPASSLSGAPAATPDATTGTLKPASASPRPQGAPPPRTPPRAPRGKGGKFEDLGF